MLSCQSAGSLQKVRTPLHEFLLKEAELDGSAHCVGYHVCTHTPVCLSVEYELSGGEGRRVQKGKELRPEITSVLHQTPAHQVGVEGKHEDRPQRRVGSLSGFSHMLEKGLTLFW